MGTANRIINILVLIAAIGAIVLAFILFNKREDVVAGRDAMADAIAKNSNQLAEKTTRDELDSKKELNVAKSKADVMKALKKFDDSTKAIIKQRNELAKDVIELTAILSEQKNMDGFEAKKLADTKTKKDEFEKVTQRADEVIARYRKVREAYVNQFKALEKILKMEPLAEDKLALDNPDVDAIEARLADMNKKVKAIYGHAADVAAKIPANITEGLDTEVKMKDAEYATYLEAQLGQLQLWANKYQQLEDENKALKEEVEKLKNDVEELKRVIESKNKEIEVLNEKISQIEDDYKKILKERESEIAKLKKNAPAPKQQNAEDVAQAPVEVKLPVNVQALRKAQAKVIYVDAKSGLVVLNIGKKSTVDLKDSKGKVTKAPVVIPEGATMTVSTSLTDANPEYVCKVQVYNVEDARAFANVLGGAGMPKVGDVAFFSANDIESLPKPAAK